MEPSDKLRTRVVDHLEATGHRLTVISTVTGIGYYRLRRWLRTETDRIAHDDAVKLEEYLQER